MTQNSESNSDGKNARVVGTSQLARDLSSGLQDLGYEVSSNSSNASADIPLDMAVWVQSLPNAKCQLLEMSEASWAEAAEAEIYSSLKTFADAYQGLKARIEQKGKRGVLVFVLPAFAMSGADGYSASAGAAEGVRVLSKSLAKEWGKDEILVHTLALNAAHFLEGEEGAKLGAELSVDMSLSDPALEKLADPKTDLAGFLDLLASEQTAFWTGGTIVADGGIWMA